MYNIKPCCLSVIHGDWMLIKYKLDIEPGMVKSVGADRVLLCGVLELGWLKQCGHMAEHGCSWVLQMEKAPR